MKDDWENIPQELKDALAKALTSNSNGEENSDDYKYHVNDWIDGQKVNDAKFTLYFLERHHMRCFHGVLFDMDGVKLSFDDDAIAEIAHQAHQKKTGARGLRSIIERIMTDIMFEVPSMENAKEVIVDKEAVLKEKPVSIIRE